MKIIICPDVHGRTFWKEAQKRVNEVDKVIFLGDYLDPYRHENITFEDAVDNFKNIIDFKAAHPDKVELLLGNHDMHYLILNFMDCSRLNEWRRVEMHDLFMTYINFFKLIYKERHYLFSHAGLYSKWMTRHNFSTSDLVDIKTFLKENWKSLEDVSIFRWGPYDVGSCVWADVQESIKNPLYKNYFQIFGHTQLRDEPVITEEYACLDVRKCFILDTKTGEITGIDA